MTMNTNQEILRSLGRIEGVLDQIQIELQKLSARVLKLEGWQSWIRGAWAAIAAASGYLLRGAWAR
jgi:hypothetical protein